VQARQATPPKKGVRAQRGSGPGSAASDNALHAIQRGSRDKSGVPNAHLGFVVFHSGHPPEPRRIQRTCEHREIQKKKNRGPDHPKVDLKSL
jgi:hypothetical protein